MNFTTNDYQIPKLFGWPDYVLFLLMLAISTLIGVYFGFWGKKDNSPIEYLYGGKTMSTLPVTISLVSSTVSGITIIGMPTEMYRYGTQYWLFAVSILIAGIVTNYIYLPVFYTLQLTSTYEYLELRFNHSVRVMVSALFTLNLLLYTPIVIYVPSLVFSQVSGYNLHYFAVGTSAMCIFYTMMGGIKGVIWTDFLQGIVMVGSSIVVIILGVIHAGGFTNVWEINQKGGRIIFFEINPSPFLRTSFWSVVIGGIFNMVIAMGVQQSAVQRYLSVSSHSKARRTVIFSAVGIIVILSLSFFTGLLIYAKYHDCDLMASKAIRRPDQLLTYYVMDIAESIPGLPGLFVAGIFSAALSTMSTTLNSLGANIFEDFVRPCIKRTLTDETSSKIIKCIVVVVGVISLLLVFVVDNLGTIFQLTMSALTVTGGPMLGLFTFGMFYPRGNAKGALAGAICSLLIVVWISIGTQTSIANGSIKYPILPISVEGCLSNVTVSKPVIEGVQDEAFILYRMSFMYYTLVGLIIMLVVATIVSYFTEPPELNKLNPAFFTPIVRKYVERHQCAMNKNAAEMELLNNPAI